MVNDLMRTTGVRREKSKAGKLSKRLEKPHSRLEQKLIEIARKPIGLGCVAKDIGLVPLPCFGIIAGAAPRELYSVMPLR
jgi:hypothetical protein